MKTQLLMFLICATVTVLSQCALADDPSISPTNPDRASGTYEVPPFAQPSRSPADAYSQMDPAFSRCVDLSLLSQAVVALDASLLADVALGLAEGERVLSRKHRAGLTADELMARAAKLSVRTADKVTLDRITAAATAHRKPQWAKLAAEAKEFGGVSRDNPSPMVSLAKINSQTVSLLETVRQACDVAGLTGHKDELEALQTALATSAVNTQVKTYLSDMIDGCLKGLPEKSSTTDTLLQEFSAHSRQDGREIFQMIIRAIILKFLLDAMDDAGSSPPGALPPVPGGVAPPSGDPGDILPPGGDDSGGDNLGKIMHYQRRMLRQYGATPPNAISGVWHTNFNGTLSLDQQGRAVTGTMSWPDGTTGPVTGVYDAGTLRISYLCNQRPDRRGQAVLLFDPNGSLVGNYKNTSNGRQGDWTFRRN